MAKLNKADKPKKRRKLIKASVDPLGAFIGMATALSSLSTQIAQLGDVITLRERLAEQTSHVRRLLRDKELLQEALDEKRETDQIDDHAPPDWPVDCNHMSFVNIRDEDGLAIYQCIECGEEFDHG